MNVQENYKCPSCGQDIVGRFCSACGEKKRVANDLSLKHYIEESIEGFTHFDNKFFRSIKLLFFKPGALTSAFERGERVPYMKPMQLFVISNLLFFFFFGGFNVFTVPLNNYLTLGNYVRIGTLETFNSKFGNHADVEKITVLFNQKIVGQSKAFIFLFIPFIALGCSLLFFRKKKHFTLHLVFATHFFSFLLLFFMFFGLVVEFPFKRWSTISIDQYEIIALSIIIPVMLFYLLVSVRRFYKIKWIWCLLSSLCILYFFMQVLQMYRIGLFFKIIHSIEI
ncbi:MAG TPA: DUF3667 domain-containing protein [Segetibacter sp.]|jgi:hypothetical protein